MDSHTLHLRHREGASRKGVNAVWTGCLVLFVGLTFIAAVVTLVLISSAYWEGRDALTKASSLMQKLESLASLDIDAKFENATNNIEDMMQGMLLANILASREAPGRREKLATDAIEMAPRRTLAHR